MAKSKFNNGNPPEPARAKEIEDLGGKIICLGSSGWPDLVFIDRAGVLKIREVKRIGNSPTPEQIKVIHHLRKCGLDAAFNKEKVEGKWETFWYELVDGDILQHQLPDED